MKGFTKRLIVGTMAASMIMSTSLVALAADPVGTGTSGGAGTIEGVVETDVYKAALPTESTTAYNYIVDPQGLIRKTNAAKYAGKTFGEGTIFFANTSGENDYSNTSDVAKIVNKSSKNLSVTVTATATPDSATGAATVATAKPGASSTALEVYLGITDTVDGSTEKALSAAGATMSAVLGAAPEDAYEYKYDDAASKYSYDLKTDVSAFKFAEYGFQINGEANANAEWKEDTAVPAVSVKWDVDLTDDEATVATPEQTDPVVEPTISGATADSNGEGWDYTADFTKGTDLVFTVDFGTEATEISSAVMGATLENMSAAAAFSVSGDTATIAGTTWAGVAAGTTRYCKITLDDGTEFVIKLTVRVA